VEGWSRLAPQQLEKFGAKFGMQFVASTSDEAKRKKKIEQLVRVWQGYLTGTYSPAVLGHADCITSERNSLVHLRGDFDKSPADRKLLEGLRFSYFLKPSPRELSEALGKVGLCSSGDAAIRDPAVDPEYIAERVAATGSACPRSLPPAINLWVFMSHGMQRKGFPRSVHENLLTSLGSLDRHGPYPRTFVCADKVTNKSLSPFWLAQIVENTVTLRKHLCRAAGEADALAGCFCLWWHEVEFGTGLYEHVDYSKFYDSESDVVHIRYNPWSIHLTDRSRAPDVHGHKGQRPRRLLHGATSRGCCSKEGQGQAHPVGYTQALL
jgi:hypothetical protein